jgi:hypothetical protein
MRLFLLDGVTEGLQPSVVAAGTVDDAAAARIDEHMRL